MRHTEVNGEKDWKSAQLWSHLDCECEKNFVFYTYEYSPALNLNDNVSHWKRCYWFCCRKACYQWMSEPNNFQMFVLVIDFPFFYQMHMNNGCGCWTLHRLLEFYFFKSAFSGCTAFWSDATFGHFKSNIPHQL